MGGSIAWTIRNADGEEHRMKRWTNIMPHVISDDFLAGDPKAFDVAMTTYNEMKDDWLKNGPNGPFEYDMTDMYAPYPYGLRPAEYGAIVTDFATKTLISANHYTSFDYIYVMRSMWPRFNDDETGYEDRIERYTKLYEEGRILNVWVYDDVARTRNKVPLPEATNFRDMFEKACVLANDTLVNFDVAPFPGWTFHKFNSDTFEGRTQTYQAVLALGFVLSEEEQQGWVEWIDEVKEEEDE